MQPAGSPQSPGDFAATSCNLCGPLAAAVLSLKFEGVRHSRQVFMSEQSQASLTDASLTPESAARGLRPSPKVR